MSTTNWCEFCHVSLTTHKLKNACVALCIHLTLVTLVPLNSRLTDAPARVRVTVYGVVGASSVTIAAYGLLFGLARLKTVRDKLTLTINM